MKKTLLALAAIATIAFSTVVTPTPADARSRGGTALAIGAGVLGAAIIGGAIVNSQPAYAYPRWYLGNLLLRTDRYTEGFAELRLASEQNGQFLSQLFNLAWQLNKNDFEALRAAVGNSPRLD